jgi:hypothetical protein
MCVVINIDPFPTMMAFFEEIFWKSENTAGTGEAITPSKNHEL